VVVAPRSHVSHHARTFYTPRGTGSTIAAKNLLRYKIFQPSVPNSESYFFLKDILTSVSDPDPHSIGFLDPDPDPEGVKSAKTVGKKEPKDRNFIIKRMKAYFS
jgi:hypothetical protein